MLFYMFQTLKVDQSYINIFFSHSLIQTPFLLQDTSKNTQYIQFIILALNMQMKIVFYLNTSVPNVSPRYINNNIIDNNNSIRHFFQSYGTFLPSQLYYVIIISSFFTIIVKLLQNGISVFSSALDFSRDAAMDLHISFQSHLTIVTMPCFYVYQLYCIVSTIQNLCSLQLFVSGKFLHCPKHWQQKAD